MSFLAVPTIASLLEGRLDGAGLAFHGPEECVAQLGIPLLEGQVARLEAAVDAAVAAGDRRLGDDLDADRAARCRVVDGLRYGDLKRRCAAAGVDTRVRGGDGGDKGKRRRRKRRVLAARLLDG